MSLKLGAPEAHAGALRRLVAEAGLPVEVVGPEEGEVRVVRSEGRVESDRSTLQSGGWIACATALEMAAESGIAAREMGKLLDALEVKVRQCSLGCF